MYYDYKTVNRSFVSVSKKLKAKDITNHNWLLYLDNEELQGIDPYSPNLTQIQKYKILIECIQNPIYFYREVIRIPYVDGSYLPLVLNLNIAARLYCSILGIPTLEMDCRQSFKSHTSLCIMVYKFLFNVDKEMGIQSKDILSSKRYLAAISAMINHLPDYFRNYKEYSKNSVSLTILENNVFNNRILVLRSPKQSQESYDIAGNSILGSYTLIDDISFSPYFGDYMKSAWPKIHNYNIEYTITTGYYNTKTLNKMWFGYYHWNDNYYDMNPFDLVKLPSNHEPFIIHYEPEELLEKDQLRSLIKCLAYGPVDDTVLNRVRSELCIRPFDDTYEFKLEDYMS